MMYTVYVHKRRNSNSTGEFYNYKYSTLRYRLEKKGNNKIEINIMVSYICKLVNIYLKLQIKKKSSPKMNLTALNHQTTEEE